MSLLRIMVFFSILIGILGFFTLRGTLQLALIGDDWLLLYTIRQIFDIQKSQSLLELNSYLCTYCPHYSLLSIIKYLWGYNAYYYYLVSLIIRIIVAVLVTGIVWKVTKNKITGLLTGIFWVTTYVGIQSSDWVFNFSHYLGVGAVILFLGVYLPLQEKFQIKKMIFSAGLFAAALIISPPRMHGLFPLVAATEVAAWFMIGKAFNWKHALVRIGVVLFVYKVVFMLAAGGYGTSEYNFGQIKKGIEMMQGYLQVGNSAFLLNPLASLGNFVLTDENFKTLEKAKVLGLGEGVKAFKVFVLPMGIVIFAIGGLVIYCLGLGKKSVLQFGLIMSLCLGLVHLFLMQNRDVWVKENIVYTVIGLGLVSLTGLLAVKLRNAESGATRMLLVSLGWMIAFSILPWVLAPYSVLSTSMRYSLHPGVGWALWLAVVFSLLMARTKKVVVIGVMVLLVGIQINNTHAYIDNLIEHRGQETVQAVWDTFKKEVPVLPTDGPAIVYLTYDDYYLAEWGMRFGFSSRTSIEYDIRNPRLVPMMTLDFKELVSMATDGKVFAIHGMPMVQTPLKHIFAFDIKNGKMVNVTEALRLRLKTEYLTPKNGLEHDGPESAN